VYATTATEIAVANQVKRDEKKIIPVHYLGHREVFKKETFDELPKRGPWDHAIELVPQDLPTESRRADATRCILKRKSRYGKNPIEQIANGVTVLLY